MSLPIFVAQRAEQDMTQQYGWYVENADVGLAERYLQAIDEIIQRIASYPELVFAAISAPLNLPGSEAVWLHVHSTSISSFTEPPQR